MTILPGRKDVSMLRQMLQPENFTYATIPLKQLYLIHTVVPMYTSSLWCHFKKQSLRGITVAYNNSFRIIHNLSPRCSASHMFATNYVKSFNERIRSSIFSLLCRLEKSDNILFVNYLHTFIYYRSPLIKHWIDQLYAFNS